MIDKKTGEKAQLRPRFIKPDQAGIARLEVNDGIICLETFKDFPQMGRFTLRDESKHFSCTFKFFIVHAAKRKKR